MAHPPSDSFLRRNFLYVLLLTLPSWSLHAEEIINVDPSMDWWTIIENATATVGATKTIKFASGVYYDASHRFNICDVSPYISLVGEVNLTDVTVATSIYLPNTAASTVIFNAFHLLGSNAAAHLVFQGSETVIRNELYALGPNVSVENCHFLGVSGPALRSYILSTEEENTIFENCLLYQCEGGVENLNIEKQDIRLRGCKFVECDIAIYCNGGVDIGTEVDPGDNIFYRNTLNIRNYSGTLVPAEWNWWYDSSGNLLTMEVEIIATIENQDTKTNKAASEVDVVPYYEYEYGYPPIPASVVNWQWYR